MTESPQKSRVVGTDALGSPRKSPLVDTDMMVSPQKSRSVETDILNSPHKSRKLETDMTGSPLKASELVKEARCPFSNMKPVVKKEEPEGHGPRTEIVFKGPVFFGYSADDAIKMMQSGINFGHS